MEIKKRLNAVAKRLTPEIESMNMASQMIEMLNRFDEILDYCEEKIEKKNRGGVSAGQRAYDAQQAERDRIQKIHDEEADEMQRDQTQAEAQPDVEQLPEEPADAGGESTEVQ